MSLLSLHQLVALISGKKTQATNTLTTAHRWVPDSLSGIIRKYHSKTEDGDKFPDEAKSVQINVNNIVTKVSEEIQDFYNLVASQESANCRAKADIKVDEQIIAKDVPVGAILFLTKQLTDLHTFLSALPTLPSDREWHWDENKSCFATKPIQQHKTKKVKKALVKYEATKEHPAQTETYDSDEIIGYYETVHLSGAIPSSKRDELVNRVEKLLTAVIKAREEANKTEIQESRIGSQVMGYIFQK